MLDSPKKSVPEIIRAAGGPAAIAAASGGAVSVDAIYKWPKIGIPDRHWPIVMPLASATADEMLAANMQARRASESAA